MLTLSFQSLSSSADSFQIWLDELLTEREQLDLITSKVTTLQPWPNRAGIIHSNPANGLMLILGFYG